MKTDTKGGSEKSIWKTVIVVASIFNIIPSVYILFATAPYTGVPFFRLFAFILAAVILVINIASLILIKDKSKSRIIVVFGIIVLLLLIVSAIVIPADFFWVFFGLQSVFYLIGAIMRTKKRYKVNAT